MTYTHNRSYSDRFLPEISRLLGEHFMQPAPLRVDREEATDLMTLDLRPVRVACRVRRHKFLAQHSGEFTLRARVCNGARTELDKIKAGCADYLFYGFANSRENGIALARLLDLNIFRAALLDHYEAESERASGPLRFFRRCAGDADFICYRIETFPRGLVVRQWDFTRKPVRSAEPPAPAVLNIFSAWLLPVALAGAR